MNKQLTIVIPCKNEGRGIVEVLKLIWEQKLDCPNIVADSSDDEASKLLLRKYASKTVKIVNGGLPAVARNNGAKLVRTPYVLFLDADIYLKDPTTLVHALKTMIGGDYDLITCKFKTSDGEYNWAYRIFDIVQWFTSKTAPFAVGGFMLFKTEKFRELGGFDEKDKVAEDYHLSSKIKPRKFKIIQNYVYTPSRRFQTKGFWYMVKLAFNCWLNKDNESFFTQDHDYWT